MGIHTLIDQQTQLAKTYARDGAFRSAALVLEELAAKLQSHAQATDPRLQMYAPPAGERIRSALDGATEAAPVTGQPPVGAASTDGFNPYGSGPVPIAVRQAHEEEGGR